MTGRPERDVWSNIQPALDVIDRHMWSGTDPLGLHEYQEALVRHTLRHLASRPGLIIAERTGRGKSQIAVAVIASLARAAVEAGSPPVRVGLLAPNAGVLTNWIGGGGLFDRALSDKQQDSYLWRDGSVSWQAKCTRTGEWVQNGDSPSLEILADHYSFGITHGFGKWGKDARETQRQADAFVGNGVKQLDLLIIDEAHQLKSSRTGRAKAIETLFGLNGSPVLARRVLLLTATPFQLRAAPEMARLLRVLRWPVAKGEPDFAAEVVQSGSAQALQRLFERFERTIAHWLRLRAANAEAERAHAEALQAKGAVEQLLKHFIVRTDVPAKHVHTFYGQPDPKNASPLPDPARGLSIVDAMERLLFLSWDGSIASRTTFVASEQQTLTSSAAALHRRHKKEVALSAVEKGRRPLAPPRVQQALLDLASTLAAELKNDHAKLRGTVEAVCSRACDGAKTRPTLVFAERTETLQALKRAIEHTTNCSVAVVDGDTPKDDRDDIIRRFKSADHGERIDVVLASKVAEMGLDIDGPEDRDDIWLIHHDFPWNPAMVDQRNGRVWRPAKRGAAKPVKVTYPFLRDTVDERIFKRMLLRQAIAELLLGTEEVARALRLTDQSSLDGLVLSKISGAELRELTPNLAPTASELGEAVACGLPESPAPESEGLRPPWCPIELVALAETRMSGVAMNAGQLRLRVEGLAASLCLPRWIRGQVDFLCVDLVGRKQTVAVGAVGDVVEVLSVADDQLDSERIIHALSMNAEPGAAGLMLLTDVEGSERLVARAANFLETLGDGELQRIVVECARRADEWEAAHYGGEDRW